MLNKAPCPCITCGETVEIGDGHFIKVKGKGWKVQHGKCPVVQRAYDSLDNMALAMLEGARRSIKTEPGQ